MRRRTAYATERPLSAAKVLNRAKTNSRAEQHFAPPQQLTTNSIGCRESATARRSLVGSAYFVGFATIAKWLNATDRKDTLVRNPTLLGPFIKLLFDQNRSLRWLQISFSIPQRSDVFDLASEK